MDQPLMVEGTVIENPELFLETAPPKGNTINGYFPDNLLEDFVGKRIRVTIEILK